MRHYVVFFLLTYAYLLHELHHCLQDFAPMKDIKRTSDSPLSKTETPIPHKEFDTTRNLRMVSVDWTWYGLEKNVGIWEFWDPSLVHLPATLSMCRSLHVVC